MYLVLYLFYQLFLSFPVPCPALFDQLPIQKSLPPSAMALAELPPSPGVCSAAI